jgi:hypothetical protein
VAKAVFADEQVKKLPAGKGSGTFRLFLAILTRLAEDFFMSDGPRDASYRDRQNEKPKQLQANRCHSNWMRIASGMAMQQKTG